MYALKIRGGRRKFESREEEKAVDALPGDNLFRTFDRSDRPVSRRISGNWVGPLDPFPPAASGTGLTSNRAHFACIRMHIDEGVDQRDPSSDDVSSPKEFGETRRRPPFGPLLDHLAAKVVTIARRAWIE